MCGIVGFIDYNSKTSSLELREMINTLAHRGPDDAGENVFVKDGYVLGLGQTRLSIIDTSCAGHQPMVYKHLNIIFNGEIYNYAEIKQELLNKSHVFSTDSDTEVILHAFEEWGISCIKRFIGMFAIALYDSKKEELFLIRDRAGIKPFYFYEKDGLILFGSELKSFHKHPLFDKNISISSLYSYFDFGYVPSPYSIFSFVKKIDAGEYFCIDLHKRTVEKTRYWDVYKFYSASHSKISYSEAKTHLHDLLKSAFNYRMVADVPVGVFLSGGYDSTSVAAILQSNLSTPLKTFTIGFLDGNNEAPYAKETAKLLGTDHYEHYCTENEAQDIIPQLPYFYDEPFADSSAIPTILVSQFAKNHVTVALSADAGDEIFAGYNYYSEFFRRMKRIENLPKLLRPIIKQSLLLGSGFADSDVRHKLESLGQSLSASNASTALELAKRRRSLPSQYRTRFILQPDSKPLNIHNLNPEDFNSALEMAMAIDYKDYLQNDILTKVDRATMSTSLEGREPLLDHRIVEFAAALPLEYKYDGKTTKKILKDIVHEYVPQSMMERPKTGFSIPIYKWLQNDLSYLIEEHLNADSLKQSGLFNVEFLLPVIKAFKENKFHYKLFIWKLLMFQMWYAKWMK